MVMIRAGDYRGMSSQKWNFQNVKRFLKVKYFLLYGTVNFAIGAFVCIYIMEVRSVSLICTVLLRLSLHSHVSAQSIT